MSGPLSHLRRTPLRRALEAKGARWRDLADVAVADRMASSADPRLLALADLSPLPRLGIKGRETIAALAKRGVALEPTPNRAFPLPEGGLALVLSPGEVVLLSNLRGDGDKLAELEKSFTLDTGERAYPVPRRDSHAWFAVTGTAAPAMLAKLCAVDLRAEKFPEFAVAQTSVAKLTTIVVRADIQSALAFHLLADSASAIYFSSCLIDAAREFGGEFIGLSQLPIQESA